MADSRRFSIAEVYQRHGEKGSTMDESVSRSAAAARDGSFSQVSCDLNALLFWTLAGILPLGGLAGSLERRQDFLKRRQN